MPNIKSVIKDVKRSEKNRLRNQAAKSQVKTAIKKARVAVESTSTDAAETHTMVRAAIKIIDRTAKRGIIHKNAAARRKSRLMKRANVVAANSAVAAA